LDETRPYRPEAKRSKTMTTQEGMRTSDVSEQFTAAPAANPAKRVAGMGSVLYPLFDGFAVGFVYPGVYVAAASPPTTGTSWRAPGRRGRVIAGPFLARDALHCAANFLEGGVKATTVKHTTTSKATAVIA
jgi:hypothetical protein